MAEKFWYIKGKGKKFTDPETGKESYPIETVEIDERLLARLLEQNGFRRYNSGDSGQNVQPIVKFGPDKIVEFVNNATVKLWVEAYVKNTNPEKLSDVRAALQKKRFLFTADALYDWLPEMSYLEIGLPASSPKEAWFARRNGLVCVRPDYIELVPYGKKDIYLWREQIMQRDWTPGGQECVFADFMRKVAGPQLADFQRAAGYILTDYFDPTTTKAVILNDAMSMDTDVSDGRRGKTLWMWVLSNVKSGYCRIDGKNWEPYSKFRFQEAEHTTRIIYIDDVAKDFDFESMFSVLSAPKLSIEKKNGRPFNIPAVKFVISTNRAIAGDSASSRDRRYELEFQPHYSAKFSPLQDYGHTFVNDWTVEEMQSLDRYCFSCVQESMRNGLREQHLSSSLMNRVALGGIPAVFIEWAESLRPGLPKPRTDYKNSFMSMPGVPNSIKNELAEKRNLFNDWMRSWAKQKKWDLVEDKHNGIMCFTIKIPESTLVQDVFTRPELERIDAELEVALQTQDYERCAILRDKKKAIQDGEANNSQAI